MAKQPGTRHFFAATLLLAGSLLPTSAGLHAAPADWTSDLSPITAKEWNAERAAHLLERAAFGATPEEIAQFAAMAPQEAVRRLVEIFERAASAKAAPGESIDPSYNDNANKTLENLFREKKPGTPT